MTMNTFYMNILAADKPFYTGSCESLIVPSLQGKYGIMANHSNIIIAVIPGALFYRPPGEETKVVAVSHGLVKVENNKVLVLVDRTPEDIETIGANMRRSSGGNFAQQSKQEYYAAQARLARAMSRLLVKNNYGALYGRGKK